MSLLPEEKINETWKGQRSYQNVWRAQDMLPGYKKELKHMVC